MENNKETRVIQKKSKSDIIVLIVLLLACAAGYFIFQNIRNAEMNQDVSNSKYAGRYDCVKTELIYNGEIQIYEGRDAMDVGPELCLFSDGTFRWDLCSGKWSESDNGVNLYPSDSSNKMKLTENENKCLELDMIEMNYTYKKQD